MTDKRYKLHHEDLDVYRASIAFLALAASFNDSFSKRYSAMAEQFRRASLSIPLNIAEGYGKRSSADRSRFYDIARGSAHECAAILDAAKIIGMIDQDSSLRGKELLYRIVSMLARMRG